MYVYISAFIIKVKTKQSYIERFRMDGDSMTYLNNDSAVTDGDDDIKHYTT